MERTRTSYQLTPQSASNTSLRKGLSPVVTAYTASAAGTNRTMTDVVVEKFDQRSQAGDIIVNPMTSETQTCIRTPRTSRWEWTPYSAVASGGTYGFDVTDVIGLRFPAQTAGFPAGRFPKYSDNQNNVWSWAERTAVITEAFANVAPPEAMALVTLAERKETIDMLTRGVDVLRRRVRPFERVRDLYDRGKLKPERFLREMEAIWLQLRYGVLPLAYEIQGYSKALASDGNRRERATARAQRVQTGTVTWVDNGSSSMISTVRLNWRLDWKVTYRAGVIYARDIDLQSQLGLCLWDIPSAAWEAAWLSFVADWFANTGDYLAAQTARFRAQQLAAWFSVKVEGVATATYYEGGSVTSGNLTSQPVVNGSGATWSASYTGKGRWPVSTVDIGWTPRLAVTPKRIIDGFSLIHQALSTKLRR